MRIRVPKTRLVLSGRRLAVLCAAWVALGAAMNVGVAWALALGLLPLWPIGEPCEQWLARWPVAVPESWPDTPDGGAAEMRQRMKEAGLRSYLLHWSHGPVHVHATGDIRIYSVLGFPSGWPAHAMTSYKASETRAVPGAGRPTRVPVALPFIQSGIPLERDPLTVMRIPLTVRWRGFLLNMLLYVPLAAVVSVYGVAWPFVAVRRKWRRARDEKRWRADRCLGCAYDLSGLMPGQLCPECGREKPWPDLEGHLADE